jgi:thioredoxin reductase
MLSRTSCSRAANACRAARCSSPPAQSQQSALALSLGCEFNDKGTVRTGKYESTHLPGLFVCGDASRAVQWVIVAASEGAEAAFAINSDLLREDLR